LKKYKAKLQVGSLDTKKKAEPTPPPTPPAEEKKELEILKPEAESGHIAPMPGADAKKVSEAFEGFGDMVPYADPAWYQTVSGYERVLQTMTDDEDSITRLTTTSLTLPSVKKSAHGWRLISSQM